MAETDRDMGDSLIKLRLAAEVTNGNAQQIIVAYRDKPVFCSNSLCPAVARAQQRANARKRLLREHRAIKHIASEAHEWDGDAIDLIRRVSALKTSPVFVGDQSFPTAHEAAMVLGDTVLRTWQDAGGEDAVECAPDRAHAEHDGEDADIAIEVSLELWRQLQKLRDKLPGDLWGQIQQEHLAACQLLDDQENTVRRLLDMAQNKPFFWSENQDAPFPFEYGSDLHWLWGWGQQVYDCLYDDQRPSNWCRVWFLPSKQAADAMMRFSVCYPSIVRQVEEQLDYVEKEWSLFESDGFDPEAESASNFVEALSSMVERIRVAVETIAGDSADTPDTKTDNKRRKRNIVPNDPAVLRLAKKINKELSNGGTKIDIARDFTDGNEKEAQRLMKQLRRYPDLLS